MKKLLSIALAIMMMLCFAACADRDEKDEDIVRPPVRESEFTAQSRYDTANFNIAALKEEADAIVRLKVKNWTGYIYLDSMSCFEAEVIEVYKGDVPKEIILAQRGTPECTFENFPLFTYGEELLLFLNDINVVLERSQKSNPDFVYPEFEYDNASSIVGTPLNVWNIATLDSGEAYIVPQISHTPLVEELIESAKCKNYGDENGISAKGAEAAQILMATDLYDNPGSSPRYIFKLSDVTDYIKDAVE